MIPKFDIRERMKNEGTRLIIIMEVDNLIFFLVIIFKTAILFTS